MQYFFRKYLEKQKSFISFVNDKRKNNDEQSTHSPYLVVAPF